MTLEFSHVFENYSKNFMKIRQVGADLFCDDERAGITELIVAFRIFVNATQNFKKNVR
jgi:hypothetical protein